MANRKDRKNAKTMEDYRASNEKLRSTAKVIAIVMVVVMVVFTVVSAVIWLI